MPRDRAADADLRPPLLPLLGARGSEGVAEAAGVVGLPRALRDGERAGRTGAVVK